MLDTLVLFVMYHLVSGDGRKISLIRQDYTGWCKMNIKKQWGRFLMRPLFVLGPSAYFYHIGIERTCVVKQFRILISLKKKRNKSKHGKNCQNIGILPPKNTYFPTFRAVATPCGLPNDVDPLCTVWETNPGLWMGLQG